ncbi:trihelix transcription factor GT-4-like isoform X1 [Lycium ferocissimum]|uniref:trihelix transcription factor GT-4-like isoform X1 n=1 Tax=Lycium ferocissimum TaxID=112874 RepID=UPI0028166D45|nr:trihelix transcription factor GT-4-like isoform X1 [Lycium ferocissimum]
MVKSYFKNGRPSQNIEGSLDHDAEPALEVSPLRWRPAPRNGWSWHFNSAERSDSFKGRVISVKWGDKTKRIGIDGTAEAIKEAIKSAFMLRTKRAFWLEDENGIVRAVDRDMPLRNYTLHVDEGLTIKICMSEKADDLPVQTEDKTFYSEDDFHDFLSHRGWTHLREKNRYRSIDRMDELCAGAVYRGGNYS